MANIRIRREHNLGQTEVRQRAEKVARTLQDKLEAKVYWKGNTLNFQRSGASGSLSIGESHLDCNVKLGMLLSPLKGKIESAINKAFDEALS